MSLKLGTEAVVHHVGKAAQRNAEGRMRNTQRVKQMGKKGIFSPFSSLFLRWHALRYLRIYYVFIESFHSLSCFKCFLTCMQKIFDWNIFYLLELLYVRRKLLWYINSILDFLHSQSLRFLTYSLDLTLGYPPTQEKKELAPQPHPLAH